MHVRACRRDCENKGNPQRPSHLLSLRTSCEIVTFGAIELGSSSPLATVPELDSDTDAENEARQRDERDHDQGVAAPGFNALSCRAGFNALSCRAGFNALSSVQREALADGDRAACKGRNVRCAEFPGDAAADPRSREGRAVDFCGGDIAARSKGHLHVARARRSIRLLARCDVHAAERCRSGSAIEGSAAAR